METIRCENLAVGDRHHLFSAAANLAELGCTAALAHELLTEVGLDQDSRRATFDGNEQGRPRCTQDTAIPRRSPCRGLMRCTPGVMTRYPAPRAATLAAWPEPGHWPTPSRPAGARHLAGRRQARKPRVDDGAAGD
ncbi:MAG: hypothetical protein U0840_02040 [Gemmataceae bacterium]